MTPPPARPNSQPRPSRRVGEDRILSLPNVVTTSRLVLVPVFVWLLVQPHHRDWFEAAILLAALGSTDWVDGQLARRLDQVTNLGKVLDPTADRVLLATAVIGILAVGAVPIPVAVIAMAREGLVAVAAVGLALAGARRIDVTRDRQGWNLRAHVRLPAVPHRAFDRRLAPHCTRARLGGGDNRARTGLGLCGRLYPPRPRRTRRRTHCGRGRARRLQGLILIFAVNPSCALGPYEKPNQEILGRMIPRDVGLH